MKPAVSLATAAFRTACLLIVFLACSLATTAVAQSGSERRPSVQPPPVPPPDVLTLPQTLEWNEILKLIKAWDGSDAQAQAILEAIRNHYNRWYAGSSDPWVQSYAAYWSHQIPFWQQNLDAFKDWLRNRQARMLQAGEMPGQWVWNNAGVVITMQDESAQDHILNTGINLGLWNGGTIGAYGPASTAVQLENELIGGGAPPSQPRFRVHISHLDLGNGLVRGYIQIIDRKLGVTVSSWYVDYPKGSSPEGAAAGGSLARKIESEIKEYLNKEAKLPKPPEKVKEVK